MYDLHTLRIVNLLDSLADKLNSGFLLFSSVTTPDTFNSYIVYESDVVERVGTESWYPVISGANLDNTPIYYADDETLKEAGLDNVYLIVSPVSSPTLKVFLNNGSEVVVNFKQSSVNDIATNRTVSKWNWYIAQ